MVRAIRGATTVKNNTEEEMLEATGELLTRMVKENNIDSDDIISVIFTVTYDLDAAFPAKAARQLGWVNIALMCTNEINVPGSLKKCIRVLMHVNSEKKNKDIRFIYLKGARVLRPDLN